MFSKRQTWQGWLLLSGMVCFMATTRGKAEEKTVAVQISQGHEIGKNDYGRPVNLIAAALEVKPDVFREAFSGVTRLAAVALAVMKPARIRLR